MNQERGRDDQEQVGGDQTDESDQQDAASAVEVAEHAAKQDEAEPRQRRQAHQQVDLDPSEVEGTVRRLMKEPERRLQVDG